MARYDDEHHYESGELSRPNELLNIRVNTLTRATKPAEREREPIYERSSDNDSYNSDYEDISDL